MSIYPPGAGTTFMRWQCSSSTIRSDQTVGQASKRFLGDMRTPPSKLLLIMLVSVALLRSIDCLAGEEVSSMESGAAYISSGTSLEPRSTSTSTPMIHGTLGGWMVMFHANAFITDIQQNQLKGRDKLFSTNWLMPE